MIGMAEESQNGVPGPLGPFAAGFVADLSRQGFMPETVGKHMDLLAALWALLRREARGWVSDPADDPVAKIRVSESVRSTTPT